MPKIFLLLTIAFIVLISFTSDLDKKGHKIAKPKFKVLALYENGAIMLRIRRQQNYG